MSLLDTALAKVEDLATHLRSLAEQDVPKLEADAAKYVPLAGSLVVQALNGFDLAGEAEKAIADVVRSLAGMWGSPKAAPADPTAPVDTSATADAQGAPAAPADPAAAQPAA